MIYKKWILVADNEVKFNGFHLLELSTSNRLTHLSSLKRTLLF